MRFKDTDDSISVIYYPSENKVGSHIISNYLAPPTPVNEGMDSNNQTMGGRSTQMRCDDKSYGHQKKN